MENIYTSNCIKLRENRKLWKINAEYSVETPKLYFKIGKCDKSVLSLLCFSGRGAQINFVISMQVSESFIEFHQGWITAIIVFSCSHGCAAKQNYSTMLANANQNLSIICKSKIVSLHVWVNPCVRRCCKGIWLSDSNLCFISVNQLFHQCIE